MSTDTEAPEIRGLGWDELTEAWLRSYIDRMAWRFKPEMDEDDLRQEAMIKWLKMKTRYAAVTEPKHFFSLFKSSVANHFTDLEDKLIRRRKRMLFAAGDEGDEAESSIEGAEAPENTERSVMLRLLVDDAPEPIRTFLKSHLEGDLAAARPLAGGLRETRKGRLARSAGIDESKLDGLLEEIEVWAREKMLNRG